MLDTKRLGIYLNDHLAGSVTGIELVKRIRDNNPGDPVGVLMEEVLPTLAEDQQIVEELLERIDVSKDQIKKTAGWVAEKLGRLKLNGQLTGYSPLSRLIELEGLKLGVYGRYSLWNSLTHIATQDDRLAGHDYQELAARAEKQMAQLEELRLEAVDTAFSD